MNITISTPFGPPNDPNVGFLQVMSHNQLSSADGVNAKDYPKRPDDDTFLLLAPMLPLSPQVEVAWNYYLKSKESGSSPFESFSDSLFWHQEGFLASSIFLHMVNIDPPSQLPKDSDARLVSLLLFNCYQTLAKKGVSPGPAPEEVTDPPQSIPTKEHSVPIDDSPRGLARLDDPTTITDTVDNFLKGTMNAPVDPLSDSNSTQIVDVALPDSHLRQRLSTPEQRPSATLESLSKLEQLRTKERTAERVYHVDKVIVLESEALRDIRQTEVFLDHEVHCAKELVSGPQRAIAILSPIQRGLPNGGGKQASESPVEKAPKSPSHAKVANAGQVKAPDPTTLPIPTACPFGIQPLAPRSQPSGRLSYVGKPPICRIPNCCCYLVQRTPQSHANATWTA